MLTDLTDERLQEMVQAVEELLELRKEGDHQTILELRKEVERLREETILELRKEVERLREENCDQSNMLGMVTAILGLPSGASGGAIRDRLSHVKYTTRVKRFCNNELGWANWFRTHCDIFWDKGTRQLGVIDTSYIGISKCLDDGNDWDTRKAKEDENEANYSEQGDD